jgi:CARDB
MKSIKKYFYVTGLSSLLLWSVACKTCEQTMILTDLIYYGLIQAIAGPKGFIVGETLKLRHTIENAVGSMVDACATTNSPATEETADVYYQGSNGGWQYLATKTPSVSGLSSNEKETKDLSFTPQTPGSYLFEFNVDPRNNVPESNNSNNGDATNNKTRAKIGFETVKAQVIVTIEDPTGKLKPVADAKDVKFEFGDCVTVCK